MFEIIGIGVGGLFVLVLLIQLYYYLFVFGRLSFYKKSETESINEPVSVVICAKNEAQNLHRHLPVFFTQDYPDYEVIVVNDCSVDESEDILEEFEKKHPNLHVVNLKEDEINPHDKKLALTIGIKGAKNDLLLLTDADCVPSGPGWIRSMVKEYAVPSTEIVLGYGAYQKQKGLLNKLIRFDSFYVALQYLSFALGGNPYMGVGRNLSYRKSLFFRNKGFATHYHIRSGDDDIFINRSATRNNTKVEISDDSRTYSVPKKTYKTWFNQKRRHITTGKYYKPKHKFSLGLLSVSQYFFFLLFILLLILQFYPIIVISAFFFRFIIQLIIFKKSMSKLGEKDLWILSPFYELVLLFFYPALLMGNIFIKRNKWK